MNALEKAKAEHRKYVSIGMDIRAALVQVTAHIRALTELYENRHYSKTFRDALIAERDRLNIESSAMHSVIREGEA